MYKRALFLRALYGFFHSSFLFCFIFSHIFFFCSVWRPKGPSQQVHFARLAMRLLSLAGCRTCSKPQRPTVHNIEEIARPIDVCWFGARAFNWRWDWVVARRVQRTRWTLFLIKKTDCACLYILDDGVRSAFLHTTCIQSFSFSQKNKKRSTYYRRIIWERRRGRSFGYSSSLIS